MNSNILTQKGKPEDLSDIRTLLQTCNLPESDLTTAHMQHFYLIKENESIIGTIGLEIYDSYGLLRSLAVSPSHRKQGMGQMLTDRIEKYARNNNLRGVYLLTTTAESFFSSLGYSRIDREEVPDPIRQSPQFRDICPSTAVAMCKVEWS